MYTYVVIGKSHSGDTYGPFVFTTEPGFELLLKILDWCGDDGRREGAEGSFGSHIDLSISKCMADEIARPVRISSWDTL